MKKGTFLTNMVMLISIIVMYLGVIYTGGRNTTTYISLGILTVIAVIVLAATFFGLNKISQITGSFRTARKKILGLYVKDPDYVWEGLSEEKFVFKNSILDGEFNNFKKEMGRLEDEGSIFCQADIGDYINERNLFTRVKKNFLDYIPKIIFLVGILGVFVNFLDASHVYMTNFDIFLDTVLVPSTYILGYSVFISAVYMVLYRFLLGRMCDKCSLFVGDFYKFVVPCAKNDLANNILYLQQLQIQNNEKLSDNILEVVSDKLNDTMVRQSEKFTELSRQIECMTSALARFNEGVDSLSVNIKDLIENERVLSKDQIEVLKDCLVQLEKKVDSAVVAVEEKPAKKTTRKRTTKVKKEEDKIKKDEDKSATSDSKEEVVVEVAPVKKKRGRKSKAEKEAELKAAMELAMKEANKVNDNATEERITEEIKLENESADDNKVIKFAIPAEEQVQVEEVAQVEEQVQVEVAQVEEQVQVEEVAQVEEQVQVEEVAQVEEQVQVEVAQVEEQVQVEEVEQVEEQVQVEEVEQVEEHVQVEEEV